MPKRPVWDTFPGAWYTTAVDAVMPNGRTLQIATYHHYRDQWAQAFDLNYEDSMARLRIATKLLLECLKDYLVQLLECMVMIMV